MQQINEKIEKEINNAKEIRRLESILKTEFDILNNKGDDATQDDAIRFLDANLAYVLSIIDTELEKATDEKRAWADEMIHNIKYTNGTFGMKQEQLKQLWDAFR